MLVYIRGEAFACQSEPLHLIHMFEAGSLSVVEIPVLPVSELQDDRIREELAALGVMLKDSKDGTTWEAAR